MVLGQMLRVRQFQKVALRSKKQLFKPNARTRKKNDADL
jgi:hypothetical protein